MSLVLSFLADFSLVLLLCLFCLGLLFSVIGAAIIGYEIIRGMLQK